MHIRTILLLSVVLSFSVGNGEGSIFCSICEIVIRIVENNLKKVETVTKKDLSDFADAACAHAPKLEVFNVLCSKVKDDLIDAVVQIIESVEREGNETCHAISVCP
uniref:Saposin B-type domain-containing protein n=1 Tax=Caenorhabditis japonica TaxID=281687 RepID=A0A8R1DK62_CAEJA